MAAEKEAQMTRSGVLSLRYPKAVYFPRREYAM